VSQIHQSFAAAILGALTPMPKTSSTLFLMIPSAILNQAFRSTNLPLPLFQRCSAARRAEIQKHPLWSASAAPSIGTKPYFLRM
jgi:hypothetical protein